MNEPHPAEQFYQERDTLSLKAASLVMGTFLVIIGILSAIAWGITRVSLSQRRPFDRFPERQIDPRAELPQGFSTLIDQDAPGLTRKHHEQDMLRSYGWVDPGNRIVRIPIDQAMDLIASGRLPEDRRQGPTK